MSRLSLIVFPLIVIVSIWKGVLIYSVSSAFVLGQHELEHVKQAPLSDERRDMLRFRVLHTLADTIPASQVTDEAQMVLNGAWKDRSGGIIHFAPAFDAKDLVRGPSYWQLQIAGLIVPDKLINAYRITGNIEYLKLAARYAANFLAFEETQILPVGLLWNDHAISERVYVLSELWHLYQESGQAKNDVSLRLLKGIERCRYYLSQPSLYTYRTNHGVMQNLALMHLSLAFPSLPKANEAWKLGRDRLLNQLQYYVGPEGVVMEHSTEYHAFGVYLVSLFQNYLAMKGEPIPAAVSEKYLGAMSFLKRVRRPDGSLPRTGDTTDAVVRAQQMLFGNAQQRVIVRDVSSSALGCWNYPISGYSVWRDAESDGRVSSHLLTAWPRFPGLGHFRPMDFSVFFWANGTSWWTDTGYWGYDHPMREAISGWDGTNAPYFVGELTKADTEANIKAEACEGHHRFLSVGRKAGAGGRIAREIIQISSHEWLVIDSWMGNSTLFRERWTTDRGLRLEKMSGDAEYLVRGNADANMRVKVWTSPKALVSVVTGAMNPIAGWVYADGRAVSTPAILIQSRQSDGWVATYWTISNGGSRSDSTRNLKVTGPDDWTLSSGADGDLVTYSSDTSTLKVGNTDLHLIPFARMGNGRSDVRAAVKEAAERFPTFHPWLEYRWKVTWLVMTFEAFLLFAWWLRRRWPRMRSIVELGGAAGWISLWVWIQFYYLA